MRSILKDSTDQSIEIYIIDSTTGEPELGVVWNTAGMDLKYRREGEAVVNITEATLAALTTAHADGGFLEIGNGSYRLDLPDAAVATGADSVVAFGTVTGMIVLPVTIPLVAYDPQSATNLGLSDIAAILTDTGTTLPSTLTTILGYIDTEIAAIKAVTDLLPDAGALTTIGTDTARLTAARAAVLTDLIDGGRLDLLIDAIKVVTDQQGSLIINGTVDTVVNSHSPTTVQFQADDITEATADHFNDRLIIWLTGDLAGQMTVIEDYLLVGGIGQFEVTGMTEPPANNDTFVII